MPSRQLIYLTVFGTRLRSVAQACVSLRVAGRFHDEHTPARMGYRRTNREFDEQGRLIVKTTWFEAADSETVKAKG
jgi:hypothetical protein